MEEGEEEREGKKGWGFLAILLCSLIKVMTQAQEMIPPTSTYTARYTHTHILCHASAPSYQHFANHPHWLLLASGQVSSHLSVSLFVLFHFFLSYVPILTFLFPFSICSFFTLPPSFPYHLFILCSVSPFQKHFK